MRYLFVAAALLLIVDLPAKASQAKPKPNVLIIIADDWSWPHAGAYGDKIVKTPHFDKLTKQGMLFHRAYTAAPSCTPSRAGILTGQAVHRLQEGGNLHGVLPPRYVCFPELLAQAGYILGLVGKGWGPGSLEGTDRPHNPAGPPGKNFRAFLKGLPADRPFYFWFGSQNPHRPYTAGAGVKAGMKLADVKVPPIWPDTAEVRSDILDYYSEVQDFDSQIGDLLQALEESGRAGETIVIILSDNGMPFPRGKANLYDLGTHMPLAVLWPGRVRPGRDSKAFISYTDLAPTILEAAGLAVPKDMTGRSFLDLLTSDKEAKDRDRVVVERERHAYVRKGNLSYPSRGLRTEKFLYIRNLRPERWPAGDPEHVFSQGTFGDIDDGPTKRVLIKLQDAAGPEKRLFELACAKRPAEELYDLNKDPHEVTNVAAHADYATVCMKMRDELETWMRATSDPRAEANGGDDRFDTFKYFGAEGNKSKKAK